MDLRAGESARSISESSLDIAPTCHPRWIPWKESVFGLEEIQFQRRGEVAGRAGYNNAPGGGVLLTMGGLIQPLEL